MLKFFFLPILICLFPVVLWTQQIHSTNIARLEYGIIVYSNGDYSYKTVAGNACDGFGNTYWAGLEDKGSQILTIDFNQSFKINSIKIIENNPRSFITNAKIQYFNGYNWEDLLNIFKYEPNFSKSFEPVTTSKLRLVIEHSNSPETWVNQVACIHSFEVYGYKTDNQKQNQNVPIIFRNPIPNRIRLLDKVDFSFSVNKNLVSKYRFKLDTPGDWLGGIGFNLLKWSDWKTDNGTNIIFNNFKKEGNYKFVVKYKLKGEYWTHKITKEIKVYWEYPEIRTEAFNIDYSYINRAPTQKEKYYRAAQEYYKAYQMWYQKFNYEYNLMHLDGHLPQEIVQAISKEIVQKSSEFILNKVGLNIGSSAILSGLSLYNIIKQGYTDIVLLYRSKKANLASTMTVLSYAAYEVYQKKYESFGDEENKYYNLNRDLVNLAPSATITYSSISLVSYKGYRPNPLHTVDGIIKQSYNLWSANTGSGTGWISYQFNFVKKVNEIDVYGGSVHFGDLKINIAYMDSFGSWRTLTYPEWQSNSQFCQIFEAQDGQQIYRYNVKREITCRAIKVIINGSHYPFSHLWRTVITEVEIYGK